MDVCEIQSGMESTTIAAASGKRSRLAKRSRSSTTVTRNPIAAATGARFSLLPPENASGNYVKVVQRVPVKIVFEPGQDPDHRLRPGMSVMPTVYTKSSR